MLSDAVLDRAWARISSSTRIGLPATINLLDHIEAIHGRPIVSNKYRSFWVESVLEHPEMSVTKAEFKEMFRRMFDMDLDTALESEEQDRDELASEPTQNIREQTANLQRIERLGSDRRMQEYQRRVQLLRQMLTNRDRSHRYLDLGTELEINRKLVKYLEAMNELYRVQGSPATQSQSLSRLESGIAKQEDLLAQLQKKFKRRPKAVEVVRGTAQRVWRRIKEVCLVLVVLMVVSYFLSLWADRDDEYVYY